MLDELGYTGWPKTSGNRGIHIACRIEPNWTFPEVRRVRARLRARGRAPAPKLVTTAWWKEERGERVFIDYNQNARDRTIASAYSVRARRDATVSAPVTWDELPDVETEDFTIPTMRERFAKLGDVQAGIDDAVCDLRKLLEWVERDETEGLGEAPYPPNFPKMPGEPARVQPSRAKKPTRRTAAARRREQRLEGRVARLARRAQLAPGAVGRILVLAEAQEARAVAEAVALHLVVAHLGDELGPDGRLLEPAACPSGSAPRSPARARPPAAAARARRSRRAASAPTAAEPT